ncbi:hypothetical protein Dimus_039643 [Dionaea muscipula]
MFLRMEVMRTTSGITLSQARYAIQLLDRFHLLDCKPVKTPLAAGINLSSSGAAPLSDPTEYRQLVGSLQYLTLSRPDIVFAVNHICQFLHQPTVLHLTVAKRILRYVKGTLTMGLHFYESAHLSIRCFSDADWAGCPDTRRSTTGFAIYLGPNLISWGKRSKRLFPVPAPKLNIVPLPPLLRKPFGLFICSSGWVSP